MPLPSPPDPGIATRDALRGLRLVLKRGAKLSVEKARVALPEPFEGVSKEIFEQATRVTHAADSLVQQILGLNFHEDSFAAPVTLRRSLRESTHSERKRDASNLYFALSLSLRYFGLRQLFVSETICAQIVSTARQEDQSLESACVWLYRQLTGGNAVGNPPVLVQHHSSDEKTQITKVAYAVSLWAFADRDPFNDPELELLEICCDVATFRSPGTALEPDDENALSEAFSSALKIV